MQCEYCPREFPENMDGLAMKTFHEILWHASTISPPQPVIPFQKLFVHKTNQQGNHGRYGHDTE